MPMLVTIGLFYAVGHWNAWFDATIFIDDIKKMVVYNSSCNQFGPGRQQKSRVFAGMAKLTKKEPYSWNYTRKCIIRSLLETLVT